MVEAGALELTTVADDEAVAHEGQRVHRWPGLAPGTPYEFAGTRFRTLPAHGERLATFATVNDVHFGESVCGLVKGTDIGPTFRAEPGEPPYPEVMNRGAIREISQIAPDAVIAKGDLTSRGSAEELARFHEFYGGAFGERLHWVLGNHDVALDHCEQAPQEIALEGARLVVLDTTWPGHPGGKLSSESLDWLDEVASRSVEPLLVFGHHPVHAPDRGGTGESTGETFGLQPDDSTRLIDLIARRPRVRGYFAGHTHRNRIQRFEATGDVPFVEVSCVKDYPGTWAEYRVYEGSVLQIVRRIGAPSALRWSEKTRVMFNGSYAAYALGRLEHRCFSIDSVPRGF